MPISDPSAIDRRDFLKWIGPAGLAGVGLCSCWGCSTTPVTHRRRLLLTPESQETQMGVAAYQDVKTKNKPSANSKYLEVVGRVGKRLAAASHKNYDWEFVVIADQTQNAFCLPGGKVAFYEGILPICQNEAGVAVVMSHEISHALARHGGERMSQQMEVEGVGKIVQLVAQRTAADKEKAFMAVYDTGSKYGFLLPYSREHESEADEIGIHLMAQAGYDPSEAPRFWTRFAVSHSGQKPAEWSSTHPSDEHRAAALERILPKALTEYEAAPNKLGIGESLA